MIFFLQVDITTDMDNNLQETIFLKLCEMLLTGNVQLSSIENET